MDMVAVLVEQAVADTKIERRNEICMVAELLVDIRSGQLFF